MVDTVLSITGPGIADYSARGLSQTLEPIDASAQLERNVNGDLLDLSDTVFRKYRSTISCTDGLAPALDGIWPGMELTVDCVATLRYKTAGGSPARTVVSGSSTVIGAYTTYRPQLVMRVTGYSSTEDEYGATVAWQLALEEV